MANTAMRLSQLLADQASLNVYIMFQSQWTSKYEANQEKLEAQTKLYDKWTTAYDNAQDVDKKCQVGTKVWKEKDQVLSDDMAEAYANAKVKQYDADLSEELEELDIDYDTMKTMYETLVTELQSRVESEKQTTATAAQDTGLLQS